MSQPKNKANASDDSGYTVAEVPPVVGRQRRSVWGGLFEECRGYPGQWRRTARSFSPGSAAQCASDIRNAHRRDPAVMRMRGLRAGERWEAAWGPNPDAPDPACCYIWLRYMGQIALPAGKAAHPLSAVSSPVVVDGVEYAW